MKAKGARRPTIAASAANAALRSGRGEAPAIRIGLAASNNPPRIKRKLPRKE